MDLCFVLLFCVPYFIVQGVFGDDPDEVKSVSVKSGDSVTLQTDIVKQRDDLIVWSYGSENTVVAKINGEANSTKFSEDEKFKDRLKLNDQTGDLIINDITSQHSGRYKLRISSNNKVSYKTFNLTVYGHLPYVAQNPITKAAQDSESPAQRLIVITAVSCTAVFCVIFIIIIYRKKRMVPVKSSESQNLQNVEIRSINSSSTSGDEESSKCLNEKQQHWIEAGSV